MPANFHLIRQRRVETPVMSSLRRTDRRVGGSNMVKMRRRKEEEVLLNRNEHLTPDDGLGRSDRSGPGCNLSPLSSLRPPPSSLLVATCRACFGSSSPHPAVVACMMDGIVPRYTSMITCRPGGLLVFWLFFSFTPWGSGFWPSALESFRTRLRVGHDNDDLLSHSPPQPFLLLALVFLIIC